MQLQTILEGIPILQSKGSLEIEISAIVFDSRKAVEDSVYVAIKGSQVDGHFYISAAIDKGSRAILVEDMPSEIIEGITYIQVKDTSKALGQMASNFYDNPSKKLTLVGITGTNGKTSVTTLLHEVFAKMGYKSGLLSTVEYRIGDQVYPSTHTTPDVVTINKFLAEAVKEGCEYMFMEVSSHGIDQKRIEGLEFKVGGFTNLTHDHLDYHETFQTYLNVKKSFFDGLSKDAIAITNIDDKNGPVMLQNTLAKKVSYATKKMADYHGKLLEVEFNGMLLNFNGKEFWTTLIGKFNVYNLLLVYAVAMELGLDEDEILKTISTLKRVPGRFETLQSPGGIYFIVDYAHTPDALENVLKSVNEIRTKNERVITVVGCGGDRDREKRPAMGKIATQHSTLAIFTSDNPRSEDPQSIIDEMEKGVDPQHFTKYTSIPSRKDAIKMAIKFSEPKDIVVVAGKGHENYQEINGIKNEFDDKKVITELCQQMSK